MLTETRFKIQEDTGNDKPAVHATYIPSALLLLMALDNGWDIVRVKPMNESEQNGLSYLVTLRSRSDGKAQHLIIPQSPLVDKIFEQRGPVMTRPC